ncbi:hypothetical protein F5887DRAFT_1178379 [Amanita rubescens]|nr:hypothetical protein F5887DRAFT_1178379 [Amanita rubescens]
MKYQDPDSPSESCKRKRVRFATENTLCVPSPGMRFSTSVESSSGSSGGPLTPPDLGSGGSSLGLLLPGPTPYGCGGSPPNHPGYDYDYQHGYGGQPGSLPPKSRPRAGSVGSNIVGGAPIRAPPARRSISDGIGSTPLQLHALLEFSSARGPAIRWDLVDIPSSLTLLASSRSHGSRRPSSNDQYRFLDEPATDPPTSSMSITSPHLPWIIRIHPSSPDSPISPDYSPASSFCSFDSARAVSRNSYISVRDVLTEIYFTLRRQISQSDYALLPSERDRERAGRAYKRRYKRVYSGSGTPSGESPGRHGRARQTQVDRDREYDEEKAGGLRRVDFLMEKSRFGGISKGRNVDEWVLHVE